MRRFYARAFDCHAKPAAWEDPRVFLRMLIAILGLPFLFLYCLVVPE